MTDEYAWFARFRDKLDTRIKDGAIAHLRPIPDDLNVVSFGWFTRVGKLDADPTVKFEIWFDTYLDAAGPYHLGCWHKTAWTKAQGLLQPLAEAWDVTATVYAKEHREHEWPKRLKPEVGEQESSRIPTPLVDRWGNWGYAGLYAVRDPMRAELREVVDNTIEALRRLVEVVRVTRKHAPTLPIPDAADRADRHRRICEVLARDGQQQARRLALAQHGACLISGESVPEALEAAHIHPVCAGGTDAKDNILLLRADLHRLFDAGLLTICGGTRPFVKVARQLIRPGSSYAALAELKGDASTISAGQWLALETRNHPWDEDLGLSHIKRSLGKNSLLIPSSP